MSFLGGLAGTLGKILETQDAEQRKESATRRAEDRADMRAFNKEDNIYEKDGKMFSSITLSNGQVIEKELSPKAVARYKGEELKQKAADIDYKNTIDADKSYQEAVAEGFKGTRKDYDDKKEDDRSLAKVMAEEKVKFGYDSALASLRSSEGSTEDADSTKFIKTIAKNIMEGKGRIKNLTHKKGTAVAEAALKGGPNSRALLSQFLSDGKYERTAGAEEGSAWEAK